MNIKSADLLIINGMVLTMNPHNEVLTSAGIAVKGGHIVEIGASAEIQEAFSADEILDASDHILMPGLVDTHFHTGQQFV